MKLKSIFFICKVLPLYLFITCSHDLNWEGKFRQKNIKSVNVYCWCTRLDTVENTVFCDKVINTSPLFLVDDMSLKLVITQINEIDAIKRALLDFNSFENKKIDLRWVDTRIVMVINYEKSKSDMITVIDNNHLILNDEVTLSYNSDFRKVFNLISGDKVCSQY